MGSARLSRDELLEEGIEAGRSLPEAALGEAISGELFLSCDFSLITIAMALPRY